jgi:hypothetical protein
VTVAGGRPPQSVRLSTFTLDEILGNTTDLPGRPTRHRQPRPGDARHLRLVRPCGSAPFPADREAGRQAALASPLGRALPALAQRRPLLAQHAHVDLVAERWDHLLRAGGSLKPGYVSAAPVLARLRAGSRQHPLAKSSRRRAPGSWAMQTRARAWPVRKLHSSSPLVLPTKFQKSIASICELEYDDG